MIEPGIYLDLSNEDYHADPAISRSGIMTFLKSPHKYWAEYLDPDKPRKDFNGSSSALILGNAFHTLVLEPTKFTQQYAVKPEPVLLKDVGREAYDLYKLQVEALEQSNKTLLNVSDYHVLNGMFASLYNNKQAWGLIEGAAYESSYFWKDEHTDVMCKARPDILHDNMIIDLKTCTHADTKTYQKEMYQYGYYIQGAIVREGVKKLTGNDIPTVINICVEKTYPYEVAIKIISESALDAGLSKFKNALLALKRCRDYNIYSGYEPEIVELPGWAI